MNLNNRFGSSAPAIAGLMLMLLSCTKATSTAVDTETGSDGNADTDTDMDADADGDIDGDGDGDGDADGDSETDTDSGADTDTDTGVDSGSDADTDTDTDTDADTDTDSDKNSDSDTDSDGDVDTDIDADTDADADADTDADADSDADADTDTDADACTVPEDEFGSLNNCTEVAPPLSFEPEVQWSWIGEGDEVFSVVTPLVVNLTDDNGDGVIDLCDIPDIVVVAFSDSSNNGGIYALDGATGAVHFRTESDVSRTITPAVGDIDNDGLAEIVSADERNLVAFENDGTFKWRSNTENPHPASAVALADLDGNGDVEIIIGNAVFDHNGIEVFRAPEPYIGASATAVADLDGEAGLEVVLGHAAYHADGSLYYRNDEIEVGFPQIADMDGDSLPEVLITNKNGLSLLEHDGATKFKDLRPTGQDAGAITWYRPATVHDFDRDGKAEFAVSSGSLYTVYESDATIVWSAVVADLSGGATGTAFDFLGDGTAEAMYADESRMFVYDENGAPLLDIPRTSFTLIEYPVVADVDNDGSAEIVVVSSSLSTANLPSPTVQVIRDVSDRWIQARRIWNQHTYHVTNVREDGTIPQVEQDSWQLFNTFRTNIQIENGTLCHTIPVV